MGKQRIDHAAGIVLLRREEWNRSSVSLSLITTQNAHLLVGLEFVNWLDLNDVIVFYQITLLSNPSRSSEKKRTLFILPIKCIESKTSTHRCLGCRCSESAQGRKLSLTTPYMKVRERDYAPTWVNQIVMVLSRFPMTGMCVLLYRSEQTRGEESHGTHSILLRHSGQFHLSGRVDGSVIPTQP